MEEPKLEKAVDGLLKEAAWWGWWEACVSLEEQGCDVVGTKEAERVIFERAWEKQH